VFISAASAAVSHLIIAYAVSSSSSSGGDGAGAGAGGGDGGGDVALESLVIANKSLPRTSTTQLYDSPLVDLRAEAGATSPSLLLLPLLPSFDPAYPFPLPPLASLFLPSFSLLPLLFPSTASFLYPSPPPHP